MGVVVIIVASLIGYVAAHLFTGDGITASGVLVLYLMTCLGLVGFIDDFVKLFMRRSRGLRSGAKLAGQAVAAAVFAILAVRFPGGFDLTPASMHLSGLTDFGVSIGPVLFVVWAVVRVTGTSKCGEPHGRPRWPRLRCRHHGAGRLCDHRGLAVSQRLHHGALLPAWPSSPGPSCCCSCSAGCS
jgi:hypothetical protein